MINKRRKIIKPLIPRQDRFCRAFVHYGSATTAARTAGYAPASARQQGWRLLRTPRIQARIREIQAELADHHNHQRDALVGKLEVVYRRALEEHQFYTAARSAQLQAQMTGVAKFALPAPAETPGRTADDGDAAGVSQNAAEAPGNVTECLQMRHVSQKPSQMHSSAKPKKIKGLPQSRRLA